MIELVPLSKQFQSMKDDILRAVGDIVDSGTYILGPNVRRFEEEVAAYVGARHAIGVANGTDALVLTLEALGIGPGDEVVTTPFTFIATAEAVSRVGAVPVFADIDPATYNLDPSKIEERITPATRAILPVHLFGRPAEMDAIRAIAKRHGLCVIEDACQAFGAAYRGKRAGALGDAACFSFFPTKNLGTVGDGGMIVTNDDEVAARVRKLRQHGSDRKYYHSMVGYNSRLDELHAAILLLALAKIDDWNAERRRLAKRYRDALQALPGLAIADEAADAKEIYHLFVVDLDRRSAVMEALRRDGIQSGVYYPLPLHLQAAYAGLGYSPGSLPVAERLAERLLAIPMSPFLGDEDQDIVIAALRRELGGEAT